MKGDRKYLDNLARLLRGLGFTEYESKVLAYLSLSREFLKISEVSSSTGVPRTKVYSIVNSLNEKGLVRLEGARPIRVSAPPPSELASILTEMIINEASEKLSSMNRLFGLNLLEGLWLVERTVLPVIGERIMLEITRLIVRGARERLNLVFSEKNAGIFREKFPITNVNAVVDSPSSLLGLDLSRSRCRVVGEHGIFMVLNEKACILSDEDLSRGIYVSEERLILALSNLFRGLYASGIPVPR